MTQTLLLIRHGQASAGSANYDRLSDRGRIQSERLGAWWHAREMQPHACFHGTLERQRDTAGIVLEAANLKRTCSVLTDLDEYNHRAVDTHFGTRPANASSNDSTVDLESMTYEDYLTTMRRWRDDHQVDDPVEAWRDFAARGWEAIRESARHQPPDTTLAYFTSGGIISTVLASVLDLDFEHCIDAIWRVRNASITAFAFDGEQPRLIEFNNVTHLELHQDPDLITLI